jgi:peptide/nickel transport system ATP-binding protein
MGSIIVPEKGVRGVKLTAIPGTPPNLKKPPAGCRFADRCRYATAECKCTDAGLMELADSRRYRCIRPVEKLKEAYASYGY